MKEITIDYAGFKFSALYEYTKGEVPEVTHLYIYEADKVNQTYLGISTQASFQFIYDNVPGLFEKLEQAIEKEEERSKNEQENSFSLGS